MFFRSLLNELNLWKNNPNRKPLIIRGARQVGKTTAVEMFAKQFKNYAYLNLETKKDRDIFKDELTIQELIQAICISKNIQSINESTLFFIDEIQNSSVAIKSLRYFYESFNDLHVIAAGSLLEIALSDYKMSFPVGRVQFLYLHPLSFEEFLIASEEKTALDMYRQLPFKNIASEKLFSLFHQYTLIGGMPEIIKNYLTEKNITSLTTTYESIVKSYIDDSEKYAPNSTMQQVLRHCVEAIPFESGNRIKFANFGNSNYKSREVGEALRKIERARLIHLVYPSTSTQIPIMPDKKKSPKLQFVDTGLLNYFVGLQQHYFQYNDLHAFYKGIIAEHIVRQEIIAQNQTSDKYPLFWVRESAKSSAEVDLILQYENLIIPVEVKAGKAGSLKSLHQFMDRVDHPWAIRLSADNLEIIETKTSQGKKFKLLTLPYFLTGKIYDYIKYFIKNH